MKKPRFAGAFEAGGTGLEPVTPSEGWGGVRSRHRACREVSMSEAKRVLEEAIERWNATDRDGWAALYTEDVEYEGPGGTRISGLADLKEKYFDALSTAAPDRASRDVVLIAEGDHVVELARYTGTHTDTWRSPDGLEIPATGRELDFPFVGVFQITNGKIRSIRIYYDQVEVLTQLGLMPASTPS
jgi:steroid delta-isomerase-like uncharacterized protein